MGGYGLGARGPEPKEDGKPTTSATNGAEGEECLERVRELFGHVGNDHMETEELEPHLTVTLYSTKKRPHRKVLLRMYY